MLKYSMFHFIHSLINYEGGKFLSLISELSKNIKENAYPTEVMNKSCLSINAQINMNVRFLDETN